jgi:hypothetical protein
VREFYSIGLVLVPLTANLLWKPGVLRGMTQLGVVTGLTYLVLTRVLLAFTNLSLSSFELLYEDTAVDFLGNAKAYVLLLTTAAVAARFNLRYGWDFGGILVPALLGPAVVHAGRAGDHAGGGAAAVGGGGRLLRYTPLGRFNLEGPRKVALVFTVAVALKWTAVARGGDGAGGGAPARPVRLRLSAVEPAGAAHAGPQVGAQGAAADAGDGAVSGGRWAAWWASCSTCWRR